MNRDKINIRAYIFILPISVLLISFYIVPILMSFGLSFTDYKGYGEIAFIGMSNYAKLFSDDFFITALQNTFFYVIIILPIQVVLSLFFAALIDAYCKTFLARALKTILFFPVISSMVLVSVVWRTLLNGDLSPLNQIFLIFGLSMDWLSPEMAKYSIVMISVWKNIGYFMIIYLAGLSQIPKAYYEAAKVDGASIWSEFIHITIPLLRRSTILVVFLSTMWALQIFDLVYMLTGGGPANATTSLVFRMYEIAFKEYNVSYAMAVANVLIFISALITIAQRKLIRKGD